MLSYSYRFERVQRPASSTSAVESSDRHAHPRDPRVAAHHVDPACPERGPSGEPALNPNEIRLRLSQEHASLDEHDVGLPRPQADPHQAVLDAPPARSGN